MWLYVLKIRSSHDSRIRLSHTTIAFNQGNVELKILIVDDNPSVRRLIVSILQPFADEVRECSDGIEALAAFQQQGSDLVLMDLAMKQLDGIQATKQIRAAHPGARIVMVTDYDDMYLRKAAVDAGACDYALKENLPDLVRLLEGMQRRSGTAGDGRLRNPF